jgi:hypothetical protein
MILSAFGGKHYSRKCGNADDAVQAVITARSRKQLPDPGLEVSRGDAVASKDLPAVQTMQNGSYLAGRISRDGFVPAKLPCPGLTHVRFYMCSTGSDCTSGDWMRPNGRASKAVVCQHAQQHHTHTHTFSHPHQPMCWCTRQAHTRGRGEHGEGPFAKWMDGRRVLTWPPGRELFLSPIQP